MLKDVFRQMQTVKAQIRLRSLIRAFTVHYQNYYTTECMNGEQRPQCYFVHTQNSLQLLTGRVPRFDMANTHKRYFSASRKLHFSDSELFMETTHISTQSGSFC